MFTFTLYREHCPSCHDDLTTPKAVRVARRHPASVGPGGRLIAHGTEDTDLCLTDRRPLVTCTRCDMDLSLEVDAHEE
jgi:hypothetical protein